MKWWLICMMSLLFLAAPARSGWDSDEDGTGDDCEITRPNPSSQRRCWYNFTGTGTGDSTLLTIDQCENASVSMVPDFDGTATACTIKPYVCLDDAANTNACYLLEGKTLSDSIPAIYGFDGTWFYFDIITAAGTNNNCRVEFRCNQ